MIKVSVIIPIYNVENYLEKCLQSVIDQTLKEIEIICVNDGSTDNSGKILKEFALKDPRVIVLEQKNQGVSIARNKGLKVVQGKYIGWVDSDDWIDSDFFERLYTCATKQDADIAIAGYKQTDEKNQTKEKIQMQFKKEKIIKSFNKKMSLIETKMYLWNKIFKKEFLDECHVFFPENVTYEDIIWTPQIFYKAQKICTVPKTYYHYRYNPNSITNSAERDLQKKQDYKNAMYFKHNFIREKQLNWELPMRSRIKVYFFGLPLFKIRENEKNWQLYFWKIPLLKFKKTYYHHD